MDENIYAHTVAVDAWCLSVIGLVCLVVVLVNAAVAAVATLPIRSTSSQIKIKYVIVLDFCSARVTVREKFIANKTWCNSIRMFCFYFIIL